MEETIENKEEETTSTDSLERKGKKRKTCDCCARRKVKCDGQVPICSRCVILNKRLTSKIECTYSFQQKPGRPKGEQLHTVGKKVHHLENTNPQCYFRKMNSTYPIARVTTENTNLEEKSCVQALMELKTGQNDEKSSEHSIIPHTFHPTQTNVHHSIPETFVVGTKLNLFLSAFATRTLKACVPLVDLPLIQKAVSRLSQPSNDPACLTYFLTAVRLGSLQTDDFQPEMQHKYYQVLEASLKPCYGEERPDVISAHLLLAFFCLATSQKQGFIKHTGFAKVLLSVLEYQVPDRLKQACHLVINGSQLPLFTVCGVDKALVQIFLAHFSINPNIFCEAFPYITKMMNKSSNLLFGAEPAQSMSAEFNLALHGMFQGSPAFAIPLMTARYFQTAMTDTELSKSCVVGALLEIRGLVDLVLKNFKLSIENLPPMARGYILQIDGFLLLMQGDFQGAKSVFSVVLEGIDFWTLQTGYFFYGDVLTHQLHFLIAAAAILRLELEYQILRGKLGIAFSVMRRPLHLPQDLSSLQNNDFYTLCLCQNTTSQCRIPLAAIALLCTRELIEHTQCSTQPPA